MSARGAGGRFTKAGPPEDAAPAAPVPGQSEAWPERPPLIALRVEPVDPGPRDPADLPPPDAPPPGAELAPGDDTDARSLVAVALDGLDAIVRLALGAEYGADPDRLDELKAAAVPVAVRAGRLVGAGDAATRTLPEWALELVRLVARGWVAYSDALVEAWHVAVAARRAELEDDDDGATDGPARGGVRGGRGDGGRDPDARAGSGPAARGPVGPGAAPADAAGPRGTVPGYGDLLAAALARPRR